VKKVKTVLIAVIFIFMLVPYNFASAAYTHVYGTSEKVEITIISFERRLNNEVYLAVRIQAPEGYPVEAGAPTAPFLYAACVVNCDLDKVTGALWPDLNKHSTYTDEVRENFHQIKLTRSGEYCTGSITLPNTNTIVVVVFGAIYMISFFTTDWAAFAEAYKVDPPTPTPSPTAIQTSTMPSERDNQQPPPQQFHSILLGAVFSALILVITILLLTHYKKHAKKEKQN
jgi:hypothetical protein